ncbi:hypothetical protein A3Q32_12995 [Alcanivorax sp. KX64203]|nr:hypothetical protein A3Q32_12995 [Alcanivorax sp. KX64203]
MPQSTQVIGQAGFRHQGNAHAFADQRAGTCPVPHGDAYIVQFKTGLADQALPVHLAATGGENKRLRRQLRQRDAPRGGAAGKFMGAGNQRDPGITAEQQRLTPAGGI